jgi:type VI secretion system protein ImpC
MAHVFADDSCLQPLAWVVEHLGAQERAQSLSPLLFAGQSPEVRVRLAIGLVGSWAQPLYLEPGLAIWGDVKQDKLHALVEREGKVVWLVDVSIERIYAMLPVEQATRLATIFPPRYSYDRPPLPRSPAGTVVVLVPCDGGLVRGPGSASLPRARRRGAETWQEAALNAARATGIDVAGEFSWLCETQSWRLEFTCFAVAPEVDRASLPEGSTIARGEDQSEDRHAVALYQVVAAELADAQVLIHRLRDGVVWIAERTADETGPASLARAVAFVQGTQALRVVVRRDESWRREAPRTSEWLAALQAAGVERVAFLSRHAHGGWPRGATPIPWITTWDEAEAVEWARHRELVIPDVNRAVEGAPGMAGLYAALDDRTERHATAVLVHALIEGDPHARLALEDCEGAVRTIDACLTRQLDAILHHSTFQAVERIWRQLHDLVEIAAVECRKAKIEILNVSEEDLRADFEDSPEIRKSGLYKILYSAEYASFGGRPFAIVATAYELGESKLHRSLLESCAAAAEPAAVPIILGAADDLLATLADTDAGTATLPAGGVQPFASKAARFLVLTTPRVLVRLPHDVTLASGALETPARVGAPYRYRETHDDRRTELLWAPMGFTLAARMLQSFDRYGTGAHIDGPAIGGCLDGHTLVDRPLSPAEAAALRERGIAAWQLSPAPAGLDDNPTLLDAPTCHRPGDALSAPDCRLGNTLLIARFAQYLKVIHRVRIGSFRTAPAIEQALGAWLASYTGPGRALSAAELVVRDPDSRRGWFEFELRIRPQGWHETWLHLAGLFDKE